MICYTRSVGGLVAISVMALSSSSSTALATGVAKGLMKVAIPLDKKTNPDDDDITQFSILVPELRSNDLTNIKGDPIPFARKVEETDSNGKYVGLRITWGTPRTPAINNGKTQTISMDLAEGLGDKKITIKQPYWFSDSIRKGKPVPLKGFAGIGDPFYQAFNDMDSLEDNSTFIVRGLAFMTNVNEMPVDSIDVFNTTGYSSPMSDFTMLAGTSTGDFDLGSVDPGKFAYARGDLIDPITGESFGTFVDGYGFPVPEPVSGLLLLGGASFIVRRPRRNRGVPIPL